jgi:hypothetical protein
VWDAVEPLGRKQFFFAKKNQKTLANWCARRGSTSLIDKSFLLLFCKKEVLS